MKLVKKRRTPVGQVELVIKDDFEYYLEDNYYINWSNAAIISKANELKRLSSGKIDLIKNTYEFVRDEIKHSWDIQDKRVTISATDVLREGVGICWAKSNLLAALLRANTIPAGICYQRLTLGDTLESGFCIHALNAVYLDDIDKWFRIDARGNKQGINAQMNIDYEQLAFNVRTEIGEIDYKEVWAKPLSITTEVLENSDDALYMYLHALPQSI